MARLAVNPNRMELQKLRKRLVVAKRGHKLLKDKQDALIKEFLAAARATKLLREKVEEELADCYRRFLVARAQSVPQMLEEALMIPSVVTELSLTQQNVMSVIVPRYKYEIKGEAVNYGFAETSGELDLAIEKFVALLPKLIMLAEKEKALRLMAVEIEKTRRRVNALEHVLIPSFSETIRYIMMKLEEMERSNLSRLMRIKEIVRAH